MNSINSRTWKTLRRTAPLAGLLAALLCSAAAAQTTPPAAPADSLVSDGLDVNGAIKLTVNDLVRGKLTDENGTIWWGSELVAGGTAGACQVVSYPSFR